MSEKFVIHDLNNICRFLSLLSTLMLVSCRLQVVVFLTSSSLKVVESNLTQFDNWEGDNNTNQQLTRFDGYECVTQNTHLFVITQVNLSVIPVCQTDINEMSS